VTQDAAEFAGVGIAASAPFCLPADVRKKPVRVLPFVRVLAASLLLGACQSTGPQELAPNMVRLDLTGAQFSADTEVAFKEVLAIGARETLARGYTFFRLKDWQQGPTRVVTPGEPLTANFAVTFVMMNQGETGNAPAFDARQIAR
jgi:hypothetical protein